MVWYILALDMQPTARHQCLIYYGSPARVLPQVAAVACGYLRDNYRCLCLDRPSVIAGIRSYLTAKGIDVDREIANGSLILSSDQDHLVNGRFNVERMIANLEDAVEGALRDGYNGLFATGDMSWEFGPEKNFEVLSDYERRLEELFERQPALCGICQYHADRLPETVLQQGLQLHQSVFV
jgi:hypothetical protein